VKLGWVDVQRSTQADALLGISLSFVAGATNAGGFLAVGVYTSHMTGAVSSVADNIVLGYWDVIAVGIASMIAFVFGAMTTAVMVNWCLRRHMRSAYGIPLLLEAGLLLIFGFFGAVIESSDSFLVPTTVLLLCFIMGLQNAVITKISHAVIRTTHVTGLLTDFGIELGKALYINQSQTLGSPVRANPTKMLLHALLICGFFIGGVCGALGFKFFGYISTLPLAALLILLIYKPLYYDARVLLGKIT
jgi:uncharacterized membrane protein YoaK (UPF0700 family)